MEQKHQLCLTEKVYQIQLMCSASCKWVETRAASKIFFLLSVIFFNDSINHCDYKMLKITLNAYYKFPNFNVMSSDCFLSLTSSQKKTHFRIIQMEKHQ